MSDNQCTCRECEQPMRTELQRWPHRPDHPTVLVTCDNERCALTGFTFDAETYPAKDISGYYSFSPPKGK